MRSRFAFAVACSLLALLLLGPSAAEARKFCFGTDEELVFIQHVTAKSPKGEPLQLARKLRRDCFVAPYTITDDGYVLQVAGEKTYYNLPPEIVQSLQRAGQLPNPLPDYTLGWFEWSFGHLLWIVLGGFGIWGLIGWLRKRGAPAAT